MNELLKLDSIHQYLSFLGLPTLHPLVAVVDFSQVQPLRHVRKRYGFYAIFLKDVNCGDLHYGRHLYDYQEGTLVFVAPGQIAGNDDDGSQYQLQGWALLFHPDLLRGTPLSQKMKDYSYFSYATNESLHMSLRERAIFLNGLNELQEELTNSVDKHSKSILTANIEALLNRCLRFYDRQFYVRDHVNKDVLVRFEQLFDAYFETRQPTSLGLPSVQYFADQLHLSANYFGDLVKKETGKTAQEHIQTELIERCKTLLYDPAKSVSEVAYELGFKYPHHLSRMFKKVVGCSPNEYRLLN